MSSLKNAGSCSGRSITKDEEVRDGDEVIVLEAMKMELPIVAEASGTVKEIKCAQGDAVEADAVLLVLE
ncbi:MAG: acetyl-CoA carboxylase biotin carboxyl carrier protein subunit [Deltaproteobacteria bacterium]|nr:acetyl-CoA carboxylase biotin carboxyl carrier protein subunit [Deltaproteobacteria bacterium]